MRSREPGQPRRASCGTGRRQPRSRRRAIRVLLRPATPSRRAQSRRRRRRGPRLRPATRQRPSDLHLLLQPRMPNSGQVAARLEQLGYTKHPQVPRRHPGLGRRRPAHRAGRPSPLLTARRGRSRPRRACGWGAPTAWVDRKDAVVVSVSRRHRSKSASGGIAAADRHRHNPSCSGVRAITDPGAGVGTTVRSSGASRTSPAGTWRSTSASSCYRHIPSTSWSRSARSPRRRLGSSRRPSSPG